MDGTQFLRLILNSPALPSLGALLVAGCAAEEGGGSVTPPASTGTLTVNTTSIGSVPDPDGFTVVVDGAGSIPIGVNDSTSVSLPVGSYSAELTGLADNCGVHGGNRLNVTIAEGGDVSIDFRVSCPPFFDWIAFAGRGIRDDGSGIYLIRPDGSGEMKLTSDTLGYNYPVWSPDATEIAFTRRTCENFTCGSSDLYVLSTADLSERRVIGDVSVFAAAWSPDGSRLAYGSTGDLYTVNADGSNPVNMTPGPEAGGLPSWSPDGSLIAFVGNGGISTVKPDGTDLRLLLEVSPAYDPAWSPDGTRIAFTGPGEQATTNVWIVNADGSTPMRITEDGLHWQAWEPSWSPDGTRIAYWAYRPDGDHGYQIYVMHADGSSPTRLTFEGSNEGPSWSRGP